MNKIYRVVWNSATGTWNVVSELGRGRTKGASQRKRVAAGALTAAAVLGLANGAVAQSISLPTFNPVDNDGQVGATVVQGGGAVTLTGPLGNIAQGVGRPVANVSWQALSDAGRLVSGSEWIGATRAEIGAPTLNVLVPDPVSQGTRTAAVYNSSVFAPIAPVEWTSTVSVAQPVNDQQYIDLRLGGVNSSGGLLNVELGDRAQPAYAAINSTPLLALKQTSLVLADGRGSAPSRVNWNSKNTINTDSLESPAGGAPTSSPLTKVVQYLGAITAFDGSQHTVNNIDDMKVYNNWLIARLQDGALLPEQYSGEFSKGLTTGTKAITYQASPSASDEVTQPTGSVYVIDAIGSNAIGAVGATGALLVARGTTSVMHAAQGARLINDGVVGHGGTGLGMVMSLEGAATQGQNNGVLNAGFIQNEDGSIRSVGVGRVIGANLFGGATFDNSGVINVAQAALGDGGYAIGVNIAAGSSATNAGAINIGVNGTGAGPGALGAQVVGGGRFTNTGAIYLGRGPQLSPAQAVADVALTANALGSQLAPVGIYASSSAIVDNAGTLTIGGLTQGAMGIFASNTSGAVTNSGSIDVNGAVGAVPRQNIGISVINGRNVANTGTINLTGVNAIGIKATTTGAGQSAVSSSGAINVAGGVGADGLRNYGVWSEAGSVATVSGAVNLGGDRSIGVHARGGGDIVVAGAGSVNFLAGTNQIGYFMHGAGSTIVNTGSATQDVRTANSTLFRVEDGAAFNGGTGGSVFTASGAGSTAFNITGAPSSFDSGNMTLNLSGPNATGVLIEGGAVGTVTNTATINQTGVGSTAGIVDGQKHGLDGAAVGASSPATTLNSSAALTSGLDQVTGYIARNQGKLTNSGSLTFTGAHTTGIRVETGATATNSANVSVTNGGTGILVNGPAGGLATTANNSGNITVNGGGVGDRTRGVVADGPLATANMQTGSTLNLTGAGAIGAQALNGGHVTVAGTAMPVFGNSDQIAFHALGAGSTVASSATALNATGTRSTLFRLEDGATLSTSSALTASGQGSAAIVSTGVGAQAALTGGSLNVTGNDARGVIVEGGATGSIAAGTAVTLTGANAVVGIADGQKHDLSGAAVGAPNPATVLSNQASMTLAGPGALAFIAQNRGNLLNQGAVTMTGAGATGVHVLTGGVLDNQANLTVANGTGINMEGANSLVRNTATVTANDGGAALHVHDGGGGVVGGSFVSGGAAHTVLVGSGATGLDVTDATLTSNGVGSGIENAAETGAITLANTTINVNNGAGIRTATALDPASTVTINVAAAGTGLAFETASAGVSSSDLDLGAGYVINGGAGSTGILAKTTGTMTTAAVVNMGNALSGAALVAGTAASTTNTGTLTSASLHWPVVDLSNGSGTTFTNAGTITAADVAQTAVLGSAGADTVNLAGGALTGVVATGNGSDTLQWTAGSVNGSLKMGGDDDLLTLSGVDLTTTYHVDGGTGTDTLTLAGIQHRGGSFAADDLAKGINLGQDWETINLSAGTGFTLTDKLTLAGSTLNIDANSTLFAGNGVQPIIGTPTGAPVTVNNGGTIDLTKGTSGPTDVLTINGDYVGQGGRLRLDAIVNEGGPNSTSDLLVTQTSSIGAGPTAIEVVYPAATGALTVDNGILLVDVAGQSAPSAFTLGNRVVGGAYEYLLFQGGSAANGGNAADGNWYLRSEVLACEVTDTCPPPPPAPEPPTPELPVPQPPVPPTPSPEGPTIPILRPEVAVYLANQAAATGMVVHTLHDRLGEVDYTERQRGDGDRHRAAWGRVQRDQFDSNVGELDQIEVGTDTSRYQVGGEMGQWSDGDNRLHWGLMGGYGEALTRAQSKITGYQARGKVSGYDAGIYGTWFGTASKATGLYVDSWLAYGHNTHQVKGDLLPRERYESDTWTGSVEAGYAMELGRGERSAWYVEPQAQMIYSYYSDGDHDEANGTAVRAGDAGGLTTRLGARVYPRPVTDVHNRVQPFIEANWWHHNDDSTVAFNGVMESMNTGSDTYELKLGAQLELGSGWTGWGHMALSRSDGDARNVGGMIGVKRGW